MSRQIVISSKNRPVRIPIVFTAVAYLLMHHFQVGELGWGIFYTLIGLLWLICVSLRVAQKSVDLSGFLESVELENQVKKNWPPKKSNKERLDEALKKFSNAGK